ncbi:MAG: aminotransferase class I/II-fold pyridoxal phosphate-dependent enzyme [Hyphomicrobiales bacterium]
MEYKVLLIEPDENLMCVEIDELSKRGLNVEGVSNFTDACELLKKDGTIHVVLSELSIPRDKSSKQLVKGSEIFKKFLSLRYEVNYFLYTNESFGNKLFSEGKLNGYFYKYEKDYDDISHKVKAEVKNSKLRAPFYDSLVEYAQKSKDSWHTPGHSSGYSVKNSPWVKDFFDFFGPNIFSSDISVSVPQLDSLMHPEGVIKEAQELAARTYRSRYTFFSTNGTSTSNKVLLQTLLKPGDAILLDRNCHKSVHYGVIIAGAEPLYLMPSVNQKYGIFGPIPKKRIIEEMDKAIATGKKLKVLIITNCTYDGLVSDTPYIVEEAHKRGVKVIVDEAWFGHANFHSEFYPCAMEAGADYATQSTHKTMSAFSQASMIHVQDPEFEDIEDFFMENFCMHTSTSPQYPMIASLDIARKQMAMEGYSLLQRNLDLSDNFRKSINNLKKFRVLELDDLISSELKNDNVRLDKTKITIDVSKSGFTSKEIEHFLLTKHNIQIEKSTFNTISILVTIGSTYSKLNRLYLALESIERMSGNRKIKGDGNLNESIKLSVSPIKYRPRFAFYCDGEMLPLKKCEGKIATRMVTPYPPGIPLLVPGQIISKEVIETLLSYRDYGVEIHGMHEGGMVKVMTKQEESKLKTKGVDINS